MEKAFRFGMRADSVMNAVHFDLAGEMNKTNIEAFGEAIEHQAKAGKTGFIFHFARLAHAHRDGIAMIIGLHRHVKETNGIIVLTGLPGDTIEVLVTMFAGVVFLLNLQVAGDEEGARRLLKAHKEQVDAQHPSGPGNAAA